MAARVRQPRDHTPWCLILSTTLTPWIPEETIVVSEISPMLSPKQAPPAIAQTVSRTLPPTMCESHMKMGAQAAKVPQEVPVATESAAVQSSPITATVLAVTPSLRASVTTAAPTP